MQIFIKPPFLSFNSSKVPPLLSLFYSLFFPLPSAGKGKGSGYFSFTLTLILSHQWKKRFNKDLYFSVDFFFLRLN